MRAATSAQQANERMKSEKNIFSLSLILIYASIFAFANNKNLTAPHILFFLCVGEFLS
jgi:hypothetical protein